MVERCRDGVHLRAQSHEYRGDRGAGQGSDHRVGERSRKSAESGGGEEVLRGLRDGSQRRRDEWRGYVQSQSVADDVDAIDAGFLREASAERAVASIISTML